MHSGRGAALLLIACACIALPPAVHAFTAASVKPAEIRSKLHIPTRLQALGRPRKPPYPPEPLWYTLHVRAQREVDVYARLRAMRSVVPLEGRLVDAMLPLVYVPEMRGDTVQLVARVLTHGHVMVKARMTEWLRRTVVALPDVYGFLGKDKAAPLTVEQTQSLLELQEKGRQVPRYIHGACRGEWFEVLSGPYTRQRGRLEDVKSGLLGLDLEHGNKRVYVDMFNCKRTMMITDKPDAAPDFQLVPPEGEVLLQTDLLKSTTQPWYRHMSRRKRHLVLNSMPVDVKAEKFVPVTKGAAYISDWFSTLADGDNLESLLYGPYPLSAKFEMIEEYIRTKAKKLGLQHSAVPESERYDALACIGRTDRNCDQADEFAEQFKDLQLKAQTRMWMANALSLLAKFRDSLPWKQKLEREASE